MANNRKLFQQFLSIPSGPFAPNKLNNLSLWLDASSLSLSDGNPVTTWTDKSNNAIPFTDNTGHPPTYKASVINGKPVVRFNSSDPDSLSYLTPFNPCPSNVFSVFVVFSPNTSTTSFPTVMNFNGDPAVNLRPYQLGLQYSGSGTDWIFYNGFAPASGSWFNSANVNVTLGTPTALGFVADSSQITPYVNGVAGSPVALVQQCIFGAGNLYLGTYDGTQFDFEHDIAEIIIYNRTLSALEIAQVNAYLSAKYGL